jgi:hypothetical protein
MSHLLLNKHTFFPDLIGQIDQAKTIVVFDAYIWIADLTGTDVLRACLRAADRGVKIFIRHDMSAEMFEHTPGRMPMFIDDTLIGDGSGKYHDKTFGFLTPKMFDMLGYFVYGKTDRPPLIRKHPLAEKAERHENIFLFNKPLFNHGKLILIDKTAYVGGQCISDDYAVWTDYNLKMTGSAFVSDIWNRMLGGHESTDPTDTRFIDNTFTIGRNGKRKSIHLFLKEFIETSSGELFIEMAYLGRPYVPILKRAIRRGVNVTLLVTKDSSDTNHHTNMWVLSDLLRMRADNLHIIFAKETMIHTKGLATRTKMTIGACNFHNASGYRFGLNEQNIFSTDTRIVNDVFSQFLKDGSEGDEIVSVVDLPRWSLPKAIAEITFVYIASYITLLYRNRIRKWRNEATELLRRHTVPGYDNMGR